MDDFRPARELRRKGEVVEPAARLALVRDEVRAAGVLSPPSTSHGNGGTPHLFFSVQVLPVIAFACAYVTGNFAIQNERDIVT